MFSKLCYLIKCLKTLSYKSSVQVNLH